MIVFLTDVCRRAPTTGRRFAADMNFISEHLHAVLRWSGSKRRGQKQWKRGFSPRREFMCSERFDDSRVVADSELKLILG